MNPATHALIIGLPITAVVLFCVYFQRRALMTPAKTPRAAELRAGAAMMAPMPQLGIRLSADRFIYANTGRLLGPLDGAKGALALSVPVPPRIKPGTGWFTVTFADGTTWRHAYPVIRQAEATAQLARFQAYASTTPPGQFRRTRPASLAP